MVQFSIYTSVMRKLEASSTQNTENELYTEVGDVWFPAGYSLIVNDLIREKSKCHFKNSLDVTKHVWRGSLHIITKLLIFYILINVTIMLNTVVYLNHLCYM